MGTAAIAIARGRLRLEEGQKTYPYDDATGRPVVAPQGNLTWGWGFNLMQCGSPGLFGVMMDYLLAQVEAQLQGFQWYRTMEGEPTRQSVFLDVAYNSGVHGLLHFPAMISQAVVRNWTACAAECKVADAKLDASRYAPLRQLLINGDSHT